MDLQTGAITTLYTACDGRPLRGPNDLVFDRDGGMWFSDPGKVTAEWMHQGHLLYARPDGSLIRRVRDPMVTPNGVGLSPDQRTLYVAESGFEREGVRELRAYPINSDDTLGNCTVLHTFGKDVRGVHRGVDGMCLDVDGNIVACAGWPTAGPGPLIYVFAPSGRVLETHPVPYTRASEKPTNCAFGGADMDSLFVTTGEGHLYRVRDPGRHGRRP